MKKLYRNQSISVLICLLLSANLPGCMATFPGNKIPDVKNNTNKTDSEKKSTAYLKLIYGSGPLMMEKDSSLTKQEPFGQKFGIFMELAENNAKEEGIFSAYTTDKINAAKMKYTIEVNLSTEERDSFDWDMTKVILTACTLWIIPYNSKTDYHLTAALIDNTTGKEIKQYKYSDYTSTWISFFMPVMFLVGAVDDGEIEIIGKLFKTLYSDIRKDNVLN